MQYPTLDLQRYKSLPSHLTSGLVSFYTPFCNTGSAGVNYAMVWGCVMHFMHDTVEPRVARIIILISCSGEKTWDI